MEKSIGQERIKLILYQSNHKSFPAHNQKEIDFETISPAKLMRVNN